ncbi:MAG: hypothetical protein C0620_10920 [Desulfuromonas sp.]|nr:MAG: hypothetical protein C0620_10920 [Desulfuromonas sp.]
MIDALNTSSLDSFKTEARQLLQAAVEKRQKEQDATPSQQSNQDTVSLGNKPTQSVTYSATVTDQDLGTTFTLLRDLLATTLQEQGIALEVSTGDNTVSLESLTPEQAQDLVSEDGYFGVEKTAQRIFDFAVSISGNDPRRIEAIRAGIEDGFAQAEEVWGGALPDISYETRDTIMAKLDEWVNNATETGSESES